ncbi:MAG: hypothetical protein HZB55_10200 [Deltaproteobacteria bacterium]|nr:hypothetical protein [Deltaproteobacteria bacterium]
MVPFDKIVRARVGAEKGDQVEASIQVQGAKTLEGTVSRALLCTGSTEFGNYQIEMRGLKEITFVKP